MKRTLLIVLANFLFCGAAFAQDDEASEDVFARIGDVVLTQQMLDAALSRIPEEHRLAFIRDNKKVDQLVKQILTNMVLSGQAREAGFDREPHVAGRVELAANKAITEAWLDERVRQTPEPDLEALAREYYLLHPQEFMSEPTYDVTHLLIKTETRTEEEAQALAGELRAQALANPSEFESLVQAFSESRDVAQSGGRLVGVKHGQAVEAFETAALGLEEPGDFSDVVQTPFGFHIIRLDAIHPSEKIPFAGVKDRLMTVQKTRFMDRTRARIVTEAVSQAPLEFPDGAIEKMLKRHFGENLENAPDHQR